MTPPPQPFTLGGQAAWFHDEGRPSGYFHTYDALQVGGPGDRPRKVHVLLPRDYEASRDRYPVVYMNDGDAVFWGGGAGGKMWDVAGGLSSLYAAGAVPRVIVVAVVPIARNREYTHVEWSPRYEYGGVDRYTSYIAGPVKGFIDAHYRTRPEAPCTAIVGSSHGGLASFFMATRRPDCFGKAGCLSSSFWVGLDGIHGGSYGGGRLEDSPLLEPVRATLADPARRPRLWIDWGLVRAGGFHNAVIEGAAAARSREMVALLERRFGFAPGVDLFPCEDPEGEHDEVSWARRFPWVMRALF